jgi:hypothetical protein
MDPTEPGEVCKLCKQGASLLFYFLHFAFSLCVTAILVILAQLHNCEAAENIPVKNEELRKI